ncbi:MAG: homoserine kinase, partial [Deltaproteobacteria bacterium]|nr:homoserine kinase [Deltaproteobacteria bacterium]
AQVAALVAAACRQDMAMLGRALEDPLIEPVRAGLIPGFPAVKAAALQAGAIGSSIAGSGPSVFAFVVGGKKAAADVAGAMQEAFAAADVKSRSWIGAIAARGASVVE